MIKQDVIDCFNRSVEHVENLNEDGSINWNYVEADMFFGLKFWYSSEYICECFDALADDWEGVA
jgi:hypothetical protein